MNDITSREAMKKAYEQAVRAAKIDEVPVGCVIVSEGRIVAKAHNLVEKNDDPSAHAEILAIRKAGKKLGDWRLNGSVIYVTLEPCPMCADAIQKARIDRIVYAAEDPKGGVYSLGLGRKILENQKRNHVVETDKCPEYSDKCSELLSIFFKTKRKKHS